MEFMEFILQNSVAIFDYGTIVYIHGRIQNDTFVEISHQVKRSFAPSFVVVPYPSYDLLQNLQTIPVDMV